MKKIVVWGTGKVAISKREHIFKYYDVIAYCDSDSNKWGQIFFEKHILSPKEVYSLAEEKEIDLILIAVKKDSINQEILEKIRSEYSGEIEVLSYKEWNDNFEKSFIKQVQIGAKEQWSISFEKQLDEWVNNLDSEILFWLNSVAKKGTQSYYEDYYCRQNNRIFNKLDNNISNAEGYLKDGDLVLDVGAGLWSKYGSIINGGEIRLIPVDHLAFFYHSINQIYASVEPIKCEFGLFEFLSMFFEKESAQLIIINNALDHCIDPYRSIIHCLEVLKTGGMLHLYHRRAEALFENWIGLHKWNVDYKNNDFTLWNLNNYLNVSEKLKGIAEVKVTHSDETEERAKEFIMVEIIKKKDFNLKDYIDVENDEKYMACLLEKIMHKYAEEKIKSFDS